MKGSALLFSLRATLFRAVNVQHMEKKKWGGKYKKKEKEAKRW